MHRLRALVLPIACAYAAAVPAQAPAARVTSVRGVVVDASGPVPGAEIRLVGDVPFVSVTDQFGTFHFGSVTPGTWTLVVRRIGYRIHREAIVVRDRVSNTVHVTLELVPQPLDTVAVVREGLTPARYGPTSRMHEFYRRRARGRGRFYTREDIEASGRTKLTDLLRLVPGARVKTFPGNLAEVAFGRCASPVRLRASGGVGAAASAASGVPMVALYLDGIRVDTISLRQTIAELDLSDIEAVEVYRGVSELPLEAMGNACAALFVWTRFGPGQ
jgi:hypothetical protein